MTETKTVEPCPFCGSANLDAAACDGREWQVCRDCGADGPVASNEDERIALWNTRPNPPSPDAGERREAIAKLLCDDIGARLIANQVDAPNFDKSAPHVQAYWRALAAALSPAPDADTVMVPREPTQAMLEVGADAFAEEYGTAPVDPVDDRNAAAAIWSAMLAASQVKPDPLPGFCAENAHNSTGKPGEVQ